ncbi:MAG TPA: hypothetical protein VFL94_03185 [Actinomycetales bacterium]|nr:hypothetical protein [Actinomycetales bacterium]
MDRRGALSRVVLGAVVVGVLPALTACSSGGYEQDRVAIQSAVVMVPAAQARAVELDLANCSPDARMPYSASLTQGASAVSVLVTGPVWHGGGADLPSCVSRLTIHLDQPLGTRQLLDGANGDKEVSVTQAQSR